QPRRHRDRELRGIDGEVHGTLAPLDGEISLLAAGRGEARFAGDAMVLALGILGVVERRVLHRPLRRAVGAEPLALDDVELLIVTGEPERLLAVAAGELDAI